jgi:hypothetical protein
VRSLTLAACLTLAFVHVVVPRETSAQSPAPITLDAGTRRAVVDSLAHELLRLYVDADTGRLIADHIVARARAGAYDQLGDPRRFADALSSDLGAVNGDGHLSVSYSPDAMLDQAVRRRVAPASDPGARGTSREAEAARQNHWGLARVDVLPGNVGYMKVTSFEGSPEAFEATSAALRYLQGTDAMIFDFRGMRGGSGEQSNFLISHFVGADTVPSLVVTNRSAGTREVRHTLARVPGLRRPTVPIWILTDRGTASAGEDFSFVLQQLGRARVIGDRTAGAGHNNTFVSVGHGFSASISITRVADPRTGKEWERVGVTPDRAVAPRQALVVAHVSALDSLSKLATDAAARRTLSTLRSVALAEAQPIAVVAPTLAAYTGLYEGGRVVTVEDGTLVFRRAAARPPRAFVALNDSTFVLDTIEVTFGRRPDGVMQMTQHLPDGGLFVLPRRGDAPAGLAP